MADGDGTGIPPVVPWTDSLSDEHKAVVLEKGWKEMGDVFGAIPKTDAWTSGLSDMQKGLIDSKGFKDLGAFTDSYKSLEALKGVPEGQLLKIPEKSIAEDPDGWSKIHARLGRPEKPEGYEFKVPEGKQADEGLVNWARNTFHELGISKHQGEGFINKWNEFASKSDGNATEKQQQSFKEAEDVLKGRWGLAYLQNKEDAQNEAVKWGVDVTMFEQLAGTMGRARTIEFFHDIYKKVGEATYHEGGKTPESPTSEAAKYELSELREDNEVMRKYAEGDRETIVRIDKLQKAAFG